MFCDINFQDLDEMARYARELHDLSYEESDDEVIMDEKPNEIISTCSNYIQK